MDLRLGRRTYLCFLHVLAALALATIGFVPADWSSASLINISAWLLGKFAAAAVQQALQCFINEVLPTVTRNGCHGILMTLAHIASALAPVMPMLAGVAPYFPSATFTALSLAGVLIVWVLPEVSCNHWNGCVEAENPSFRHAIENSRIT